MIRPMEYTDIMHVQRIARETRSKTINGIIPVKIQTDFINRSYSEAMVLKRMEKTHMVVAESEGIPIGFACFTMKDEDGDSELTEMYILPSHQHNGYGKKIFQYMLSILQDAQQLFVYIDANNWLGRTFYEMQGFILLDLLDEYFEGHPVETAQYVYYIKNSVLA